MLVSSLRHLVPPDGSCQLAMPVVKVRCACDALTHTFDIGVFKCGESSFSKIKQIHNEPDNLINS